MTPDRFLGVEQVAKRLKRCPETIRRYIRRGYLTAERAPGDKRQGNYLIAESAIVKFLATSRDICKQPSV